MRIEEIIKTCANEAVAAAAVSSIGSGFSHEVGDVAKTYGMSLGGFTAFAVDRFARRGDENDMRSVLATMADAPEPVLAGLRRILSLTLASGVAGASRSAASGAKRAPRIPAHHEAEARREWVG